MLGPSGEVHEIRVDRQGYRHGYRYDKQDKGIQYKDMRVCEQGELAINSRNFSFPNFKVKD